MDITILEGLQIALYFFGIIVLILLSVVLVRILKILGPILEILEVYNKMKQVFSVYAQIPDIIKDNVKNFFRKK